MLVKDNRLEVELPGTEGFSPRDLKYVRAFAFAWPDEGFVQGVLAQLPWYTHLALAKWSIAMLVDPRSSPAVMTQPANTPHALRYPAQ